MKNKNLIIVLLTLGAYLLSAFVSYSFFSYREITQAQEEKVTKGPKQTNDYEALVFDDSLPKTEECPLNGAKWSKQQRNWWEKHRPLGVMIENHVEARPQSGLGLSDIVYEAVAEGGITRFMAIYYCQDAGIVGPVRSARTYFLDMISEYGNSPLYAHVGGANTPGPADALGQIEEYGWANYNDLNQFSIGFPTFKRDEARAGRPVATEHTMYSTTSKLWDVGKKRGLTNEDKDGASWDEDFTPFTFKEDKPSSSTQSVNVSHWEGYRDFAVMWTYDPATNSYLRKNGGEEHNDRNTKKQISAKNVVILKMRESRANDGYEGNLHLLYGTEGRGEALIFQDGKQVKGAWSKTGREDRMEITAGGKDVAFNRGLIWFHILPLEGEVDVK